MSEEMRSLRGLPSIQMPGLRDKAKTTQKLHPINVPPFEIHALQPGISSFLSFRFLDKATVEDKLDYECKRFLDKATVEDELDYECKTTRNWRLCIVQEVEEVKVVLGLTPIWMTCLIFGVDFAQSSTFFTKQGTTMDRKIGKHFEIPAASLQCFISLTLILLVPIYDRIFVPIARNLTGNERGITFLQRIGTGMVISILSMIVAALMEIRRIKVAKENGLIDMPNATIPLSIFLLLPQYILFGIADVFTMVGMQEYFYDQMPDTMKTLGISVYLSVLGIGNFLSSILISVTEKLSSRNKGSCWFIDNLNKKHLDYYYCLLASLTAINFCIYIFLANCYKYKNAQNNFSDQEESCSPRTAQERFSLHEHMSRY